MNTLTMHNMHQCWDLILAAFSAVSVLNTNIVHDDQLYLNSLEACTLCIVHEQDSVMVRHEQTNYMHTIAHVLYSM